LSLSLISPALDQPQFALVGAA